MQHSNRREVPRVQENVREELQLSQINALGSRPYHRKLKVGSKNLSDINKSTVSQLHLEIKEITGIVPCKWPFVNSSLATSTTNRGSAFAHTSC